MVLNQTFFDNKKHQRVEISISARDFSLKYIYLENKVWIKEEVMFYSLQAISSNYINYQIAHGEFLKS